MTLAKKFPNGYSCFHALAVNNGSTCPRPFTLTEHRGCLGGVAVPSLQLSLLWSLKVQWAAGIISGSLIPAMLRISPPGGSSQGTFLTGRHIVTSCSEQLCQMSNDLRWGLMHPRIGHVNPGLCPTFHAQLRVSQTSSRGLGLDSGCCLQHPHALPRAKPSGKTEEPVSALDSFTERGHVEPAEKQRHREFLCRRNYYEKQGKKKKKR